MHARWEHIQEDLAKMQQELAECGGHQATLHWRVEMVAAYTTNTGKQADVLADRLVKLTDLILKEGTGDPSAEGGTMKLTSGSILCRNFTKSPTPPPGNATPTGLSAMTGGVCACNPNGRLTSVASSTLSIRIIFISIILF